MTTISLSLRHAANKTVFAACIAAFCWMPEPLGAQSPFPDENVPETGFMAIFDGKTLDGWEYDPVYWRVEGDRMVGEVTPELAHQLGLEFAERLLGGEFQAVVSTHLNTGHIHNHLVCAPIRGRVNPLSKRQV